MTPERWQQVKDVVGDALEKPDTGERSAFLAQACADDTGLRREAESLLAASESNKIEGFAEDLSLSAAAVSDSATGQRIGAYQIVRELGRGGMGAVYLAERADQEFTKQVAIKLLKRGTDTDEVLRRFRSEREILARLEHPYIARLLDAGTADDGLPYFVMEYVIGTRVTDYCAAHKLSIPERLELFLKICGAVQFAHQNLVVHRDLKPANILITADAEAKLLDFGIAKLLGTGDSTLQLTIQDQQRLTPGYASPEQVRGDVITTVSDVYSLGVLLYELLVGHSPHQFATAQPTATELQRVIGEVEPVRASAAAPTPELRRALRGDLDNILRTALRKEPERRYSGVAALIDDLRRHLADRPVRARPDTVRYRASKFIRRNKLGVAAALVLVLTMLAGIVATAWQARVATAERARAERRFNDVRRLANSFMFELHDEIDKGAVKAKQLLVTRATEYLNSLAQEATEDAELQRELAVGYTRIGAVQGRFLSQNLGDTKGAYESYGRALSLYEKLAAREPQNGELQQDLAMSHVLMAYMNIASGKPSEAAELARRALVLAERLVAVDPANIPSRVAAAAGHRVLGTALGLPGVTSLGDIAGAAEQYRKAVALYETISPADLSALQASSRPEWNLNRYNDLGALYSEFATILNATGSAAESLDYQQKALALFERGLAEEPTNVGLQRNTAAQLWNVANLLLDNVPGDQPLALIKRSLALYEQMAARDVNDLNARRDLAQSYRNMAKVLSANKDIAGAIDFNSKSLAIFQELVPRDQSNAFLRRQLALTHQRQSMFLTEAARLDEATEQAQQAVIVGEALLASDANNATAASTQALSLAQLGKCHLLTATSPPADASRRGEHLREAKSAYQRGREIWIALRDRRALSAADSGKIDEATRQIALCEAELARP